MNHDDMDHGYRSWSARLAAIAAASTGFPFAGWHQIMEEGNNHFTVNTKKASCGKGGVDRRLDDRRLWI
ncbi:MAG TPA: hypothetical protein GX509_01010 [Firmicutes bacterium]|nr:hypothetical protein [Bacillota bacterium]